MIEGKHVENNENLFVFTYTVYSEHLRSQPTQIVHLHNGCCMCDIVGHSIYSAKIPSKKHSVMLRKRDLYPGENYSSKCHESCT